MKYLVSCILCLFSSWVAAQEENNVWVFGDSLGLDFNGGSPVLIHTHIETFGAAASVSDADGNLLFYSNSNNCWDRNHDVMPNGHIWTGFETTPGQGANIVPVFNNPQRYYLFSTNWYTVLDLPYKGQLCYSIIDMSLNGGLGDVVPGKKNIMIDSALAEAIVFIPGNQCNIWMLVHDLRTALFKAYNITYDGIDSIPVTSLTGPAPPPGTWYHQHTTLSASPDGSMIVFGGGSRAGWPIPEEAQNAQTLFHFDKNTGQVSDPIVVLPKDTVFASYGACFSPDNTKLYLPQKNFYTNTGALYQFDVSSYNAADILASQIAVYNGSATGGLYRMHEGIIYTHGYAGTDVLNRIRYPNLAGIACQYEVNILTLNGTSHNGMGANVVFPPKDSTFHSSALALCAGERTKTLQAPQGPYRYHWDNGGSTGYRIISQPGTYWVQCSDTLPSEFCRLYIDTFIVKALDLGFDLGPDTTLCDNELPYVLRPGISGAACQWQDGSTADHFPVTTEGTYYATLSSQGCQASDTIRIRIAHAPEITLSVTPERPAPAHYCIEDTIILAASGGINYTWTDTPGILLDHNTRMQVKLEGPAVFEVTGYNDKGCRNTAALTVPAELCCAQVFLPTAFSPNGDGLNDRFGPLNGVNGRYRVKQFYIYNRWGQHIFTSYNDDRTWDGTFRGKPQPLGTYYYFLELECTEGRTQAVKGEINLIR